MPLTVTIKELEKFASRFTVADSGCWTWTGAFRNNKTRRGAFYHRYKTHSAYKFIYEQIRGEVPAGLTLDHLCRDPSCVNPKHLEPVSQSENIQRHYRNQTHCKRGHEFGEQPDWVKRSSYSQRRCLTCHNLRHRKDYKNGSPIS